MYNYYDWMVLWKDKLVHKYWLYIVSTTTLPHALYGFLIFICCNAMLKFSFFLRELKEPKCFESNAIILVLINYLLLQDGDGKITT